MRVIELASANSTNSWIAEHAAELETPSLVYALEQTAGRGQRGNSWESEPGKNLTASVMMVPEGIEPCRQFVISEAVALAVVDLLADYGLEAKVKWPNDIYVGDKKICGILIEHSLLGHTITRTIAGVGINVNQAVFRSDAPNPVSVLQLTGEEHDIAAAAHLLGEKIEQRMAQTGNAEALHSEFLSRLWRGDGGYYPFRDVRRGEEISARITGIAPDGILSLQTADGETRAFAFKEIEFRQEG